MRRVAAAVLAGCVAACGSAESEETPKHDAGCEGVCSDAGDAGAGGSAGASGAGGTAGADAMAGSGGVGAGVGCVDIVVSPAVLDDPDNWLHRPDAIRGGIFRTDGGLRVAWIGYRWYPGPGVPPYLDNTTPWLVVSEYDPDSGQAIEHVTYDVFPDGVLATDGGLFSFAARADDLFALGYAYTDSGQRPERVLVGKVGDPQPIFTGTVPVNGDPTQIGTQTAAGWDGEAFALHAYGAPPQFTLHVARVDDQGNIVLPFTQYGQTANAATGIVGHKTSTDPVSGRTFVFDAAGAALVSGHERDGTPLPGTSAATGAKEIEAVGIFTDSTSLPALSADPTGAWVGWLQNTAKLKRVLQRLDGSGTPTGAGIEVPSLLDVLYWTVLSRGPDEVWAAGASYDKVLAVDVKDGTPGAPSVIVDSAVQLDIRDLVAFDYQDETWLGFTEIDDQSHPLVIRVVKVKPGCVYPAEIDRK